MNTQRPSRTLWRWIGAIAALILVAGVAWNAGARVSQSRAPLPTMDPTMSGMQMSGGTSNYYRDIYADCPGGSPLPSYEICYVDGFVGPCP